MTPLQRHSLSAEEASAFHARLEGRVQGVGFRYNCMLEGRRLGLSGWVRNLPGGTVELWAEGSKAALDDFLLWLRHGPPGARVDFFTFDMTSPTGSYREFEILC